MGVSLKHNDECLQSAICMHNGIVGWRLSDALPSHRTSRIRPKRSLLRTAFLFNHRMVTQTTCKINCVDVIQLISEFTGEREKLVNPTPKSGGVATHM